MNLLKESAEYKEAIDTTSSGWPDNGIGITEKETVPNLTSLSRQLNSILFTVIKLRQEVAELKRGKASAQSSSEDIEQLAQLLHRTNLSPQGAAFQKNRGVIKVYRNPFDVLKSISK